MFHLIYQRIKLFIYPQLDSIIDYLAGYYAM